MAKTKKQGSAKPKKTGTGTKAARRSIREGEPVVSGHDREKGRLPKVRAGYDTRTPE
jgi:hypothetical protein